MDLQILINEVQARPAIWDQKNTHYHNRDVILKMWAEIGRACHVPSELAKSKWKHLRDNFRNELKKTYRGKQQLGDGESPLSGEHESKWVWFKNLEFLRDQMNSRVIGCGLGNFDTNLEESQIEPQIDIHEGDDEGHFDSIVNGNSSHSVLTSDGVMPPPKRRKIYRKRRVLMDSMDSIDYQGLEGKKYEAIRRRLACQDDDDDDDDDDTYHFLMSIRTPLRNLSIERQMYLRLKIQELIYNEITKIQQDSKRHQTSCNSGSKNSSPETGNNDDYYN